MMRFDNEGQDFTGGCPTQIDDIIGIFGRDLRLAVTRATQTSSGNELIGTRARGINED
nr:hypothetical protein [Ktedonobacter sp. SOSP1-52]